MIIEVGVKTGLRRAELANLKVGDINLTKRQLTMRMGKGMKDRIVEITSLLTTSLESYLKDKMPSDSVFGLQASTISGVIRWATIKAGVNLHFHSLRHFFCETLVDTGTDLEMVRRLMGHSNLSTTQRYIGRTDQQRREAIDRMEKPLFAHEDTPEAIACLQKENFEREIKQLRIDQHTIGTGKLI